MNEAIIPHALIGGGVRSKRPTLLQLWVLQWAPGASLAGWLLASLAIQADIQGDRASNPSLAFLVFGMLIGGALWALIAISSLPLFFVIRPWIDHLARKVTRWRGVVLAAAGVAPLAGTAVIALLTISSHQYHAWFVSVILCVALLVGTIAASEMWIAVLQPSQDARSQFADGFDISAAVRVKEDLEVIRLLLASTATSFLSIISALLPLAPLGLVLLAITQPSVYAELRWISFVPLVLALPLLIALIVSASYQLGLWQFVSVRASGILLFVGSSIMLLVHLTGPCHESYLGSYAGYSWMAWTYTLLLWLLSVPGFLVIASLIGMSWRLLRFRSHFDPVVRGWRAWPTNIWAPAARTLCLPSFLVALPRGRIQPILLFVIAAIVSALRTVVVMGLAINAPVFLTSAVAARLPDGPGRGAGQPFASLGTAITARSQDLSSLITQQELVLAVPFVLVLSFLMATAALYHRKLAGWFLRLAQRRAAESYQTITQMDSRAPVLFLRSFSHEQRLLEPPARSLVARLMRLMDRKRTLDEIVLDAASPIGPVIALGMPAESVAPLGAARLYAADSEWQETVRHLVQQSRAVIICVEDSQGVMWELKYLLADTHPAKTLCIFNPETSSATLQRAIEDAQQTNDLAMGNMLERIQAHIPEATSDKLLIGVRLSDNVVTPIFSEDASDYTHWCMVNLMLLSLEPG